MPELPEVEAARRMVQDHCCGKRIVRSVVADDSKVVDGVSPSDFQKLLDGKTIIAAHRKGKNMWLELDSPPFPSFQFGMSGAIYIKGVPVTKYKRSAVNDADEWPSEYSKLFIEAYERICKGIQPTDYTDFMELDDGLEFSFTDKRRFAKVRLLQDPASVPPISQLGPDALLEPMSADKFADSLNKKKIAIKALLLDQAYISGIGNWVADEVLYQARIHPLQTASSLSTQGCKQLHNSIKEVIQFAVQVNADCSRFPTKWIFHFRWGKNVETSMVIEKTLAVGADSNEFPGKRIEFITAGGRTTAFVPELQKLTGASSETLECRSRRKNKKHGNKNGQAEIEEASSPFPKRKKKTSSVKDKSSRRSPKVEEENCGLKKGSKGHVRPAKMGRRS